MLTIVKDNLGILYKPIETDVSHSEQITKRIGDFVQAIYRNPDHKDMQNVYTRHGFENKTSNNVFTYAKDQNGIAKWHIGDWDKVSKDILIKYGKHCSMRSRKKEMMY